MDAAEAVTGATRTGGRKADTRFVADQAMRRGGGTSGVLTRPWGDETVAPGCAGSHGFGSLGADDVAGSQAARIEHDPAMQHAAPSVRS